jgi:hypothetical protein
VVEAELEKAEAKVVELKRDSGDADASKKTNDGLNRKVQLLEEELDAAEKNVKETVEKYETPRITVYRGPLLIDKLVDSVKSTSKPSISNARSPVLSRSVTSGRRSTRSVHTSSLSLHARSTR